MHVVEFLAVDKFYEFAEDLFRDEGDLHTAEGILKGRLEQERACCWSSPKRR